MYIRRRLDPIAFPTTETLVPKGGRFKSRLPINYKLPVVFGLVVNFGDWKKLSLKFPLMSLTGNLKQMTDDSDWSTVFREIKDIKGSLLC